MQAEFCVAEIMNAHGVRGLVKLKLYLEDHALFASFDSLVDAKGSVYKIQLKSKIKGYWLAAIEGIDNRTDAEFLKKTKLYVHRDQMPKAESDEYYQKDLIGFSVFDLSGQEVGKLAAFYPHGADSHIIEIKRNGKERLYFLFDKKSVPAINIEEGWIKINPSEAFDFA